MGFPTVTNDDGTGLTGTSFSAAFFTLVETHGQKVARTATVVDLSGAAATLIALHCERACTLLKATLLYTEASSGDAGIAVKIGKETDNDYFYTGTSEVSKAQWYSKNVTLLQTAVGAGDTVILSSAGSKSGTGEIMLILEYDYT